MDIILFLLLTPQWWITTVSVVTEVWSVATMLADIISVVLLVVVLVLTVFIRIAIWIPGEQPEKFLMKVRDYLSKFIDKISLISRKKK